MDDESAVAVVEHAARLEQRQLALAADHERLNALDLLEHLDLLVVEPYRANATKTVGGSTDVGCGYAVGSGAVRFLGRALRQCDEIAEHASRGLRDRDA
jgi:hypothetical protein